MSALSPGMSRLTAVGLLLLLLLFLVLYLLVPLWRYYAESSKELSIKRHQLAQYEYLLGNEERIDEELARIDGTETGDLFLPGSKASIASANLREVVADAVRESGGELISSREYEAEAIDSTTAIGLQLQVRGEVGNLVQLLHRIESARPVIFVDELDLSSSSSRSISSQELRRAQTRGNPPSLEFRMNIVGYLAGAEEVQSGSAE
ncbi:hypothetical protein E2F43_03110 [Seongchinamella unica]|uniref:General secretion pathway protein GspM n=1 Tax=Seongchinamella unica TaxID=2547392 RepID=A0A4R5LVJ0_9GAMM|nr:type II secretion system protein GspM [Seongchinamella unica]TDG15238.1 hypothetical protein E2F43_03110 [Seongchinamella unica]